MDNFGANNHCVPTNVPAITTYCLTDKKKFSHKMSQTNICAGCLKPITSRHYVKCSVCLQVYDRACANVMDRRPSPDFLSNWKCLTCVSKEPESDVPLNGGAVLESRPGTLHTSPSLLQNETSLNETVELSDLQLLLMEVRQFREEMRATRIQVELLNSTISNIGARMDNCEKTVGQLCSRMDVVESRSTECNMCPEDMFHTIEQLKSDLNDRDQDILANDIEITNVSEHSGESLAHIVTTLSTKLGVNLVEQDIVSITRVGRPPSYSAAPAVSMKGSVVVSSVAGGGGDISACNGGASGAAPAGGGTATSTGSVSAAGGGDDVLQRTSSPTVNGGGGGGLGVASQATTPTFASVTAVLQPRQGPLAGPGGSRPRPIVVRLARKSVRDQLLRAARVRRGATTQDTGLPGPHHRFYINERLTKLNRQLFRQARELGEKLNWRFIWTRDGKIYVRQGANSNRFIIKNEQDLKRVFGSDIVSAG